MVRRKSKDVWQFGDFQTPDELALDVTRLVQRLGIAPRCILEPTCGSGAFLAAAAGIFPEADRLIGIDINQQHLVQARTRLERAPGAERIALQAGDFFSIDWQAVLRSCQGEWLIIGNPPWVTSAELSTLESHNLPEKSNFQRRSGIEAMTGKSNFDISEWMLLRYLDWIEDQPGALAVLCKTTVARKVLVHAWTRDYPVKSARIYAIDAMKHFGAAVEACLFVLETESGHVSRECSVFGHIDDPTPAYQIGLHRNVLLANTAEFRRYQHLFSPERRYTWRSGIKHDCAKVMELSAFGQAYRNGLGEVVQLEGQCLFPLLKSSDVGNGRNGSRGFMLVTQRKIGENTESIELRAPLTWKYLKDHADLLNKRSSSIYRNRPQFCIFGVGDYSFAPWKVAISGFYKKLRFVKVGPINDVPAVFDDTVYFLPCSSEDEAEFLCMMLNSEVARGFYGSMIFWSDKRPITIDLLKRLSLEKLALELGQDDIYCQFARREELAADATPRQLPLFAVQ